MTYRLILPAAVYAVIIGLSSLPADAFPETPTGLGLLAHAAEYAALGASLRWALANIRPATAVTVVVVLLLAGVDEAFQSLRPGRTPEAIDYAIDVAAATLAALAVRRSTPYR
ncbi:MAG: VanZ family protein [Actinomycetota bacterium]|nr:VanZ family protein [Actinomycetota bacterium]